MLFHTFNITLKNTLCIKEQLSDDAATVFCCEAPEMFYVTQIPINMGASR